MLLRAALRSLVLVAGLAATGSATLAQSALCQHYRAELAAVEAGASGSRNAAAQRQRQEIARLASYYRSIGCERASFSFFDAPPFECAAIGQRLRMMEAAYGQLMDRWTEYEEATLAARRRNLRAAVAQACRPPGDTFADHDDAWRDGDGEREAGFGEDEDGSGRSRTADASRLVCVRTCDGFAFPLDNLPQGRAGADEMCRALCPGAEAAAYSLRGGEGSLDEAVSTTGEPYTRLANAFKFRKAVLPSCSCRKPGQSWAEALQQAEALLGRQAGDIVVTEKKAEELSRPKVEPRPPRSPKKAGKAAQAPVEAYTSQRSPAPVSLRPTVMAGAKPDTTPEGKAGTGDPRPTVRIVGPGASGSR